MTRDDLLATFRNEVFDTVAPYLWSDAEVDSFMDDAQNMFVRFTGGITDATGDLCTIDAPIGTKYVEYDRRILKIVRAERADGKELKLTNVEDHDEAGTDEKLDNTQGALTGLVLGMDDNNLRLHRIPAIAETISLVIKRLPVNLDLTEIFEHHHRHLVNWMKYLAYNKQDAETFDKGKASEFMDVFTKYCMKVSQERETRKHKPRTVVYGGL